MSYVCRACGKKIKEGVSICQICFFPVIGIAGNDLAALAQIDEMAKEHIRGIVGDYAVGILSYRYVFQNGSYQETTIETEIAGYEKLVTDEIIWNERVYRVVNSDKLVPIQVYVQKKDGEKKTYTVEIMPPANMQTTYVGVKREGVSAQIVWGNKNNYTSSKVFELI